MLAEPTNLLRRGAVSGTYSSVCPVQIWSGSTGQTLERSSQLITGGGFVLRACSSPAAGAPRGYQSAQVPCADGQRARLPSSIYPFLGAVPAALQHGLQMGALGPLQLLVPERRSRMAGAFRDGEPGTKTQAAVPKPRGTLAHRRSLALRHAELGAVWRVSQRGSLPETPPGRHSTQGAPVWLQQRVGRQGGGERGTVGTATQGGCSTAAGGDGGRSRTNPGGYTPGSGVLHMEKGSAIWKNIRISALEDTFVLEMSLE